jgi:hypothetical protein
MLASFQGRRTVREAPESSHQAPASAATIIAESAIVDAGRSMRSRAI